MAIQTNAGSGRFDFGTSNTNISTGSSIGGAASGGLTGGSSTIYTGNKAVVDGHMESAQVESVDLSDLQFKPLEDQKQREAAAQAQAQVQQPTPQPDPSGVNSLFASPTQPVEQPVTTEQPMNPSGLFGDPVAAQQPTQVVATINVEEGTAQVKNLIQTLQSQGYNVTVEELNLDREVQLIIKFIKG